MVLKGQIALFACDYVPEGWAKCDGQNGTPNLPAFVYDKNARPIPYCIATKDSYDYLLSMILPVPYNYVPEDWSDCDGQILTYNDNAAMGSLLGGKYSVGPTTFRLPTIPNQKTAGEGTIRYIINTKGGVYPMRP